MINADVNRIILIPLWWEGHYSLMTLDRSNQIVTFLDSCISSTPPSFPKTVFQKFKVALNEQGMQKKSWQSDLLFKQESVRQQGNSWDCAIHVIQHAMTVNSEISKLTDVRFFPDSIYQLRCDLVNRFLEDRAWADCELQEVRLRDPDYQEPVHDEVEIISDDEVEILDDPAPVQPPVQAIPGPARAPVQAPVRVIPVPAQVQIQVRDWKHVNSNKELKKMFGNHREMLKEWSCNLARKLLKQKTKKN